MKLITTQIAQRFNEVWDQSEVKDPIFIAKFFNPTGSATWYASEYDPSRNICYGYVTGMVEDEWGTFSIDELEAVKLPFGLRIERDINFGEKHYSEIIKKDRYSELKKDKQKENPNQEIER